MQNQGEQVTERREWLEHLVRHVKPDKIVELGCGSGFVLEVLSGHFPQCTIIGVDISIERLDKVYERGLKNVVPMKGDFTKKLFPDNTFDTAIFVASLHEVCSAEGRDKLKDTLNIINKELKDDGIVLIQDFVKPYEMPVELCFNNEETQKIFLRFARDFRQRKVVFEKIRRGVKLDIADAVEFISKYRTPSEEDWNDEMDETHFFFTEEEYMKTAREAGFVVHDVKKLSKSEAYWSEVKRDIGFDHPDQYLWIQLVLKK